jgi:hypothetical protein
MFLASLLNVFFKIGQLLPHLLTQQKQAAVDPIRKKLKGSLASNYRPISVHISSSIAFEFVVYDPLFLYFKLK